MNYCRKIFQMMDYLEEKMNYSWFYFARAGTALSRRHGLRPEFRGVAGSTSGWQRGMAGPARGTTHAPICTLSPAANPSQPLASTTTPIWDQVGTEPGCQFIMS